MIVFWARNIYLQHVYLNTLLYVVSIYYLLTYLDR